MEKSNAPMRFLLMALLMVAVGVYWIWPADLMPGIPLDDIIVAVVSLVVASKAKVGPRIEVPAE